MCFHTLECAAMLECIFMFCTVFIMLILPGLIICAKDEQMMLHYLFFNKWLSCVFKIKNHFLMFGCFTHTDPPVESGDSILWKRN